MQLARFSLAKFPMEVGSSIFILKFLSFVQTLLRFTTREKSSLPHLPSPLHLPMHITVLISLVLTSSQTRLSLPDQRVFEENAAFADFQLIQL